MPVERIFSTSISWKSALGRLVMVADVALEEIPVTLFVASRVPFICVCVVNQRRTVHMRLITF